MGTQHDWPKGVPRVTVLVAIYKAKRFLQSKFKSLLQQTAFNDSHIFLLNCQDLQGESAFCKKFAADHTNVSYVEFDEHIGLYASWNHAILNSRSDYIVNYNADDQWHPEYLQKCVNYLDEHEQCAIVTTGVLVTDRPNSLYPAWSHIGRIPASPYPLGTAGPSPMWRRSMHDKYGLFGDYQVIGDAKFWERLHAGGEQFHLIPDDLVLYYTSPDSLERRVDEKTGMKILDLETGA